MVQLKWSIAVIFVLIIGTYGDDPFKCYKCDSTDENCIKDVTKITTFDENCATACFTKLDDNGKITRGCKTGEDACDSGKCRQCKTAECNKEVICKECKGTDECSQTTSVEDKLNSICTAEQKNCIMKVGDDQKVERRCATTTENCNEDACKVCDTPNCNTGIFPTKRRQCYQCKNSDSECGSLNNGDNKKKPCLLYKSDDECYTIGTEATKMTRGCVSDKESECTGDACVKCNTDYCNERPYKYTPKLQCVQCENCSNAQDVKDAKDCDEIPYNLEGSCYTVLKDGKVNRGCISEKYSLDLCTTDSCKLCTDSNGCNSAKQEVEKTCKRCRSTEKADCRNKAEAITGTKCRNEVTTDEPVCFTGIWNDVVIRGCMVDGDGRQQFECASDKFSNCKTCTGVDCNKNKTSGAATLKIASGLFLGILAIIWHLH